MAILNINSRTITVNKEVLLESLRKNREIHIAEYETAVADFLIRVEEDLKAALKIAKKGVFEDVSQLRIIAKAPQSHLADFDEAIEMLEYSNADELEIDTTTFKAYVKNQWPWAAAFKSTLESYKVVGSMLG